MDKGRGGRGHLATVTRLIGDYVVGKRHSRRKGFRAAEPVAIVAVERADVAGMLGLAEGVALEPLLRELRWMGALLCSEGRLTRRVRVEREGRVSRPRMVGSSSMTRTSGC